MTCMLGLTCDDDYHSCLDAVGDALPEAPGQAAYMAGCLSAVDACGSEVSEHLCTDNDVPYKLFPEAVYELLTPCFDLACADVNACVESAASESLCLPLELY